MGFDLNKERKKTKFIIKSEEKINKWLRKRKLFDIQLRKAYKSLRKYLSIIFHDVVET